jgi:16S rRNA (cytosine967-C5)-methyltransferase
MPISPARVTAFEILLRVERQDAFASDLLHSTLYQRLSALDHHLATELVMGALRWQSLLDREIAKCSSLKLGQIDPEVLASLRLGAYQLIFLDRVPQRAAIYESVELVKRARKRSAAAFTNAVLRKLAGSKPQAPTLSAIRKRQTATELAESSAHPQWFVTRWVQELGIDATRQVCGFDQQIPETAISIHDRGLAEELKNEGIQLASGHLLASSLRVVAGDVTKTQAFRAGRLALQDEASQLVALLVGHGSRILDCCAAPGGKTRALAARNPSATIIAAELHPHRARLLRRLVSAGNVQIIAADACTLPITARFDRVLADVPCSGTGTLARNPEIKWRLKPEDLLDLQARQLSILVSAMRCVAPGGKLVYSTCSLEKEENVEVVERALASGTAFHLLDCGEQLQQLRREGELVYRGADSLTQGPYLRTIPGKHPCEGFFAAILQKGT